MNLFQSNPATWARAVIQRFASDHACLGPKRAVHDSLHDFSRCTFGLVAVLPVTPATTAIANTPDDLRPWTRHKGAKKKKSSSSDARRLLNKISQQHLLVIAARWHEMTICLMRDQGAGFVAGKGRGCRILSRSFCHLPELGRTSCAASSA